MTNERAKSELEQLYMSLSEEKKKALDVAFKAMEQADNIPVMYYPQVDGITPTVVAQADAEKNCFNCKWYPDNGITKGFDEVCHKCSNSDKWEGLIKRAPWEDIAPPPKIPEAQADGDLISRQALLNLMGEEPFNWTDSDQELQAVEDYRNFRNMVEQLPSVKPQEPNTGHWVGIDEEPHEVWECDHCGLVIDGSGCIDPYDYRDTYKFCPNCGCRMVEPQERSDKE